MSRQISYGNWENNRAGQTHTRMQRERNTHTSRKAYYDVLHILKVEYKPTRNGKARWVATVEPFGASKHYTLTLWQEDVEFINRHNEHGLTIATESLAMDFLNSIQVEAKSHHDQYGLTGVKSVRDKTMSFISKGDEQDPPEPPKPAHSAVCACPKGQPTGYKHFYRLLTRFGVVALPYGSEYERHMKRLVAFGYAHAPQHKTNIWTHTGKIARVTTVTPQAEIKLLPAPAPQKAVISAAFAVGQVVNWINPERGFTTQEYTISAIVQLENTWYKLRHPHLGIEITAKAESIRAVEVVVAKAA